MKNEDWIDCLFTNPPWPSLNCFISSNYLEEFLKNLIKFSTTSLRAHRPSSKLFRTSTTNFSRIRTITSTRALTHTMRPCFSGKLDLFSKIPPQCWWPFFRCESVSFLPLLQRVTHAEIDVHSREKMILPNSLRFSLDSGKLLQYVRN